jgi:hypothetical protein
MAYSDVAHTFVITFELFLSIYCPVIKPPNEKYQTNPVLMNIQVQQALRVETNHMK